MQIDSPYSARRQHNKVVGLYSYDLPWRALYGSLWNREQVMQQFFRVWGASIPASRAAAVACSSRILLEETEGSLVYVTQTVVCAVHSLGAWLVAWPSAHQSAAAANDRRESKPSVCVVWVYVCGGARRRDCIGGR